MASNSKLNRIFMSVSFRPEIADENSVITILDSLQRRGVCDYLHLALNRGLSMLRARISALEAEGKNRDTILQSFFDDPALYRVAFQYFEALDGLARAQGSAPGAAPTPLVAPTPVVVGVSAESVIPVSERVIQRDIPEITPDVAPEITPDVTPDVTPEIAPPLPAVLARCEESAPAKPVAPDSKPDWSSFRTLTSAGVSKRGEST